MIFHEPPTLNPVNPNFWNTKYYKVLLLLLLFSLCKIAYVDEDYTDDQFS